MSRSNIMMAVTAGISLLVPLAPSAADAAAVPEFTVQVLGTNGSGCPADPASSVTADVLVGGTITLRYQNFTVYGGD